MAVAAALRSGPAPEQEAQATRGTLQRRGAQALAVRSSSATHVCVMQKSRDGSGACEPLEGDFKRRAVPLAPQHVQGQHLSDGRACEVHHVSQLKGQPCVGAGSGAREDVCSQGTLTWPGLPTHPPVQACKEPRRHPRSGRLGPSAQHHTAHMAQVPKSKRAYGSTAHTSPQTPQSTFPKATGMFAGRTLKSVRP